MTLIGIYASEHSTFIFGDTLVSSDVREIIPIDLPTGRTVSNDQKYMSAVSYLPSGLVRKLFSLNKHTAMAFCGSQSLASSICGRLRLAFDGQDPTLSEIKAYIKLEYGDLDSAFTILMLDAREKVAAGEDSWSHVELDGIGSYLVDVPLFSGKLLLAGSGAEHFAAEMSRYRYNEILEGAPGNTVLGEQQEALRVLSTAQTLMLREYEGSSNLEHAYGAFVDVKCVSYEEGNLIIADEKSHGLATFKFYSSERNKYKMRLVGNVYSIGYYEETLCGMTISFNKNRVLQSIKQYFIRDIITPFDFHKGVSLTISEPAEWRFRILFDGRPFCLLGSCSHGLMGITSPLEVGRSTLWFGKQLVDNMVSLAHWTFSGETEPPV